MEFINTITLPKYFCRVDEFLESVNNTINKVKRSFKSKHECLIDKKFNLLNQEGNPLNKNGMHLILNFKKYILNHHSNVDFIIILNSFEHCSHNLMISAYTLTTFLNFIVVLKLTC